MIPASLLILLCVSWGAFVYLSRRYTVHYRRHAIREWAQDNGFKQAAVGQVELAEVSQWPHHRVRVVEHWRDATTTLLRLRSAAESADSSASAPAPAPTSASTSTASASTASAGSADRLNPSAPPAPTARWRRWGSWGSWRRFGAKRPSAHEAPPSGQVRYWNVLIRPLAPAGGIVALRPAEAAGSIVDLFELQFFPKLSSVSRYAVYGTDALSARRLAAGQVLGLMPRDLGLLRTEQAMILDFTTRPFDTVEFARLLAIARQIEPRL